VLRPTGVKRSCLHLK